MKPFPLAERVFLCLEGRQDSKGATKWRCGDSRTSRFDERSERAEQSCRPDQN